MATKKTKEEKPKHPLMADGKSFDRDKVMAHICDCLATSSRGLGKILAAGYQGHNLPTYTAIMEWIGEDAALAERYTRARETQADFMADEINEIADEMPPLDQNGRTDSGHVQWQKNRIESRKWTAAKLKPKKYGDKIQAEVTGKDGGPIEINDTERAAKIQAILAAAESRKGSDDPV